MANQLASYNFPDTYSTLVSDFVGTVKYVASTGSNSNDGSSVSTPYLTIDYAYSQTSATANVMFVVLQGTYTMTALSVSGSNSGVLRDGGNKRVFVCCPGRTIIQWTASTADRDCSMAQFTNAGSAVYGAILKRNNNGRTTSYTVAYFRSYDGALKGNFYNCVFSETNANNAWTYQYDNYGAANFAIRNCTFYNGAAAGASYSGGTGALTIDSVFNTTCATVGTETSVLKSQTVNATTYVTTGVSTAGVYSGTYSWSATTTFDAVIVTGTTGSPTVIRSGSYTYYKFANSGGITFGNSGAPIEVLTVAGGGGGVGAYGGNAVPSGGGGAGGVNYHPSFSISAATYAITVGAGGAKVATAGSAITGGTGSDSIFGANTIIAKGGGGGGWYTTGGTGGSGGGGGYNGAAGGSTNQSSSGVNPAGSIYYGTAGGTGATISTGSGGGGGAGGAGIAASGTSGSAGGVGASNNSTLLAVVSAGELSGGVRYIAGGGGGGGSYANGGTGGAGGLGGGGIGGYNGANAGAGVVNTGGGGGGSPNTYLGGDGGSGIVILKVYTGIPTDPGLYLSDSSGSINSGNSITATLRTSGIANSVTVPYTISGVTSAQINGGSLTGNFTITSNTGTLTINTNPNIVSANLVISANGYTTNTLISYAVSIITETILIGTTSNTANYTNPIAGQMNVIQSLVTSNIVSDANIYTVSGQMNINQSVVTSNIVSDANLLLVATNGMQNAASKSYTTMTNSFNGRIDSDIIKVFGEIAQREYWM